MFCPKINKYIPKESKCEFDENEDGKVKVSDEIAERIENNGSVDEERKACYDNEWIEKLANLDKAHTQKLNLDNAEVILNKIAAYSYFKTLNPCKNYALRLMQCYATNKGEIIKCDEFARKFSRCVDKSLEQAALRSNSETKFNKDNRTYKEKFEEEIRFLDN